MSVSADVWPQLRGASGDGVSTETDLPVSWSETEGVAWSVELPGQSNSSPAVTENRLDITTKTEDNGLWVLSYDRDSGSLLNDVRVGSGSLECKGPPNLWAHRHNAATAVALC